MKTSIIGKKHPSPNLDHLNKAPPSWKTLSVAVIMILSSLGNACCPGAEAHAKEAGARQQIGATVYPIKTPEEWNQMMLVGSLSIVAPADFAVPCLGADPCVRLEYSVENLTDGPLYLLANYRTETGHDATGSGALYILSPREQRRVEALAPVVGFDRRMRFLLRLLPFDHPPQREEKDKKWGKPLLVIDPLPLAPPRLPTGRLSVNHGSSRHFQVEDVKLVRKDNRNVFTATVTNLTDKPQPIGLAIAIRDGGYFRRFYTTVSAYSSREIRSFFELRTKGKQPLLAFQLAEPRQGIPDAQAVRSRQFPSEGGQFDTDLVSWGAVDLLEAAKQEDCVLTPPPPVQERAKLTMEKVTVHFIFRFRPGSAAQNDIDQIVTEREGIYDWLSQLFRMQLPRPVQIDLYPDGEAKGLGSGTSWTSANTVNDHQIAEVYDEKGGVSPGHELAHIFSYHFPGHPKRSGELRKPADAFVEGFAGCFQAPGSGERAVAALRSRANNSPLATIPEIISSSDYGTGEEQMALVQFLVEKDPERFKRFYVRVIANPKAAAIEKVCTETYAMTLAALEKEWRSYLQRPAPDK